MRSIFVLALALSAGACSVLDQIQFNGTSLDPNKVYLNPQDAIVISPRDAYRYACVGRPLLCTDHGASSLQCRCHY